MALLYISGLKNKKIKKVIFISMHISCFLNELQYIFVTKVSVVTRNYLKRSREVLTVY